MSKDFIRSLIPSMLVLSGTIIGILLTSYLDRANWEDRAVYERNTKLFEERIALIERTTKITSRMPEISGLFSLFIISIHYNVSHPIAETKEDVNLIEKLANYRSELWSVMVLNQIYFGDSTRMVINTILGDKKTENWFDIPEEKYNQIITTMSSELYSGLKTETSSIALTSKKTKAYWTTITTLIGGILIYVIGRVIEKFLLEPLQEYKKTISSVINQLIYHADIYSNASVISVDLRKETSKSIRKLASRLYSKTYQVNCYWFFNKIGVIPSHENSTKAASSLIGLSNSIMSNNEKTIEEFREEIMSLLNIKHPT